jgi:hypothetical protein
MNNLSMYCLSNNDEDYKKIKSLGYMPVGLGGGMINKKWIKDNTKKNITNKNPYYGEYTFHYWLWKNKLKKIKNNKWVGFCTYRRFWAQKKTTHKFKRSSDFLNKPPKEWKNHKIILGQDIYVDDWKLMKLIKHGWRSIILNPKYLIKKNRNIQFHFDSFHGYGNLDLAIEQLGKNDRNDFKKFVLEKNCYNRSSMFLCSSKTIMNNYYSTVFPWMKKCEKVFGFNYNSYGLKRIYGFLIERFQSYWFSKYTKPLIWPIIFHDIRSSKII